jgi:guanylate kinase
MKNELERLSEFQSVLRNYAMSADTTGQLQTIELVLLTAPSSIGRNTIIGELIKTDKYHFITSDTTRHPRVNDGVLEKDGDTYWYKTEDEILADLRLGKYLEAAIIHNQQVSGVSIKELMRAKKENKVAITDIDIQGLSAVMTAKPDAVAIFVLPPNFEEWMRRLTKRGHMQADERQRRLASSIREFEFALQSDDLMFIVNDDLQRAVSHIDDLMTYHKADMSSQKAGRELIISLINRLKKAN